MATKITVSNNGSLRIEGEIEIYDGSGNQYDLAGRTVISLCRCGQATTSPSVTARTRAAASSHKSWRRFCPRRNRKCNGKDRRMREGFLTNILPFVLAQRSSRLFLLIF